MKFDHKKWKDPYCRTKDINHYHLEDEDLFSRWMDIVDIHRSYIDYYWCSAKFRDLARLSRRSQNSPWYQIMPAGPQDRGSGRSL